MWRDLQTFAVTPYPILLIGATGTGKTAVARAIHQLSPRARGPLHEVSLTSVPDELRHAELLGCVRGAFTGAVRDRVGAVEAAHGGTLFIDELGHASLPLQQTLLTLLEGGTVQRLGEIARRRADVRFVFASSSDIGQLVRSGRFLPELQFRIDGFTIQMPLLSERRADIEPLARRFLAQSLHELERPFAVEMTDELLLCLERAPWPGNIRQLQKVCLFMAVRLDSPRRLTPGDLPPGNFTETSIRSFHSVHERAVHEVDRCGGNKSRAARQLGMSRNRLYRLLSEPNNVGASGTVES